MCPPPCSRCAPPAPCRPRGTRCPGCWSSLTSSARTRYASPRPRSVCSGWAWTDTTQNTRTSHLQGYQTLHGHYEADTDTGGREGEGGWWQWHDSWHRDQVPTNSPVIGPQSIKKLPLRPADKTWWAQEDLISHFSALCEAPIIV